MNEQVAKTLVIGLMLGGVFGFAAGCATEIQQCQIDLLKQEKSIKQSIQLNPTECKGWPDIKEKE